MARTLRRMEEARSPGKALFGHPVDERQVPTKAQDDFGSLWSAEVGNVATDSTKRAVWLRLRVFQGPLLPKSKYVHNRFVNKVSAVIFILGIKKFINFKNQKLVVMIEMSSELVPWSQTQGTCIRVQQATLSVYLLRVSAGYCPLRWSVCNEPTLFGALQSTDEALASVILHVSFLKLSIKYILLHSSPFFKILISIISAFDLLES